MGLLGLRLGELIEGQNRFAYLFYVVSLAAGIPLLLYSVSVTPLLGGITFPILASATAFSSFFPVRLPVLGNSRHSVRVTASDLFVFAGILLISPAAATTLSAIDCLVGNFRTRKILRVLVNLSLTVFSTYLSGSLFYLLYGSSPPLRIDRQSSLFWFTLSFAVAAVFYAALNSGSISLAASLSVGKPWKEVWKRDFFWSSLTNLTGILVVASVFTAFTEKGILALSIAFPVILIMYYSYRINSDRVSSLQASTEFLQSTLDSLSAAIAILDQSCKVLSVNSVWSRKSRSDLFGGHLQPGMNYLEACMNVSAPWKDAGSRLAEAIQSVAESGTAVRFEYSPSQIAEERWYSVSVTHFSARDRRIVVAHDDITELRRAEKRIIHLAYYDELTGLPNRAFLIEHLRYLLVRARRLGEAVAVVALDLDRFERVNTTLGLQAGDKALCIIADRLRGCIRQSDCIARGVTPAENARTAESLDAIARLGGDEFLLVLSEFKKPTDVVKVVKRIQKRLAEPVNLNGQRLYLGSNAGISIFPSDDGDVETLLQNANTALHSAKQQDLNTYALYSRSLVSASARKLAVENQIRRALESKSMELHYQPIVNARTGELIKAEALVRLGNTEIGQVSPAEFIPIAEETGLIVPMTRWILEAACRAAREWSELLPAKVSVNLSAKYLGDPSTVQSVSQALKLSGLSPTWLELEITEGLLIQDFDSSVTLLSQLKELGVDIALDDFGTGFSSLSYLSRLPIDTLKIDRSFIAKIGESRESTAIVKGIIAVARTLELQIVAEGVESEEQVHFLRKAGCFQMQGYYFSKPLPADQFRDFLSNHALPSIRAASS